MTERHLVAHQFILHGILERCIEQHLYLFTLDEAHLDDALAESTMTQYLDNNTFLTSLQF